MKMHKHIGGRIILIFLSMGITQSAMAQVEADAFHGTSPASNNYFLGKTGIGTNNPAQQLHVVGDSKLDGGLTVEGALLIPKQGDVEMGPFTNGLVSGGVASSNLALRGAWISYGGSSHGLYVSEEGNVGVGTDEPGSALEVEGEAAVGSLSVDGGLTLGGVTKTEWPETISQDSFRSVSNAIGDVIVLTNGQNLATTINAYNATNRVYLLPYGTVTIGSSPQGVRTGTKIIGRGQDKTFITGGAIFFEQNATGTMAELTCDQGLSGSTGTAPGTNYYFYRNVTGRSLSFGAIPTFSNIEGRHLLQDCALTYSSKGNLFRSSGYTSNRFEFINVRVTGDGTNYLHNAFRKAQFTGTPWDAAIDFTNHLRLTGLQLDSRVQFGVINTNPPAYSGGAQLWAQSSSGTNELFAMDGSGNITKLSTHDELKHIAYSWNMFTGEGRSIDLDALAEEVVKLSGRRDIVRSFKKPRLDWDKMEREKVIASEAVIEEWKKSGEEGQAPTPYTPQPKPGWLVEWEKAKNLN